MSGDVSDTLTERGARYGSFFDHALIAQSLQSVMRGTDCIKTNWDGLAPDMQQALTVIADKIARILNGDPTYHDNWHDIQGYALLVERRLSEANTDPARQSVPQNGQRAVRTEGGDPLPATLGSADYREFALASFWGGVA